MPAADEQQLISEAKNGSREAFRCLVERHMKQAYTIAYGFVNDHHGAEEIAQDAFVRIYESLASFRGDAAFSTWLYRIVTNLSLNRVSQMKRRREERLDGKHEDMIGDTAASLSEDLDVAGHIERALHDLPTLQRAVVMLRHMNGLSTREVSNILHCSEGTVKTHLFRGLEKMRQKLQFLRAGEI
ncbi:MAG: ECF-family polymerase sigma factor [Bacteroidetes bacterium]|jgi:RNA polymerase sigma-70 factor (ECF subfamily)|nr:ECF-family polymerase sigma factor [Bacteroidota bacterium]